MAKLQRTLLTALIVASVPAVSVSFGNEPLVSNTSAMLAQGGGPCPPVEYDRRYPDLCGKKADVMLLFEGLLAMFVKDDEEYADIRIPRDAPDHIFSVEVYDCPESGKYCMLRQEIRLAGRASLKVTGVPNNKTDLYQPETANPHDFKWVLDMESDKALGGKADIDQSGLRNESFGIYGGRYFTVEQSCNRLTRVINGRPDKTSLGRVATKAGAFIYLDHQNPNSKAEIEYGGKPIPLPRKQCGFYLVKISHVRMHSMKCSDSYNDTVFYHQMMSGKKTAVYKPWSSGDRVRFELDSRKTYEVKTQDELASLKGFHPCLPESQLFSNEQAKEKVAAAPSAACGPMRFSKSKLKGNTD